VDHGEGPASRVISRAPREVSLFGRAARDLALVDPEERRSIAAEIDRLAEDALPRGVEAIPGPFRDHLRLRVGRFRVLYRVSDGELVVVAVMSGPG
jgi:mRNA-degrading endonuclease RelE of RelBE toxin-antitoxin system